VDIAMQHVPRTSACIVAYNAPEPRMLDLKSVSIVPKAICGT